MSQPQLDLPKVVEEALKSVLSLVNLPAVAVTARVEVELDLPGPIDPKVSVSARGEISLVDGRVHFKPDSLRVE